MRDFLSTKILPREVAVQALAVDGPKRAYGDPLLKSPPLYGEFLLRLQAAGVIEFTREACVEQVDCLFVGKSDGRQRLVIDCRRANRHFADPAPVSLATGDSLARLDASSVSSGMVVGQVDIKDAFYRMALPEALRPYFGLRQVPARFLGLTSLNGEAVGLNTPIHPRMRCLPRGWTWPCGGAKQFMRER